MENFANGKWEVIDGRFYNEAEQKSGAPVVVIDEEMANRFQLKVGDRFGIYFYDADATKEVTVIGIYRKNAEKVNLNLLTNMYTPYRFLRNVLTESGINQITIGSATFYLKDVSFVDRFIEQGKEKAGPKFQFTANDVMLKRLLAPFENIRSFADLAIKAVLIAGAAVMMLLMAIITRERKKEIGILRSLGFKKSTVMLQFVTEALAVELMALVIGLAVGQVASDAASQQLLNQGMKVNEQMQHSMQGFDLSGQVIEAVYPSLGISTYLLVVWMALLITSAGTLTSCSMIVRYEPIKILASEK
ncbi:ABC transporter permease [Brevibacillus sp. B_LB10_24]|uniref:ABC transporter permease n=1 Tax=Brevibacillus sp. B_LB10_24 TaxID=3380645 RepID=UPI0038BC3D40